MVYTTQKNLQVLISLLKQYEIRDIVISPGSRNMAFVRSVETDPFFNTHSVVDERSAAYFAIGIWVKTGRPVVLSSTSAQATRNYIPGMTEAYYRGAQLVVVTADYRTSYIGQGVMQTVEQMSIPKDAARYSVKLPIIFDGNDLRYCVRIVNEALLELDHRGTGPVHIDIPTEEHWTGGVLQLPEFSKIDRYTDTTNLPPLAGKRILVLVGQHRPFSEQEQIALDEFSLSYNVVVYTNLLSNYRGPRSVNGNLFAEGLNGEGYKPYASDITITIGGQHGDYGIDGKVRQFGGEHWDVSQDGKIRDTYGRLKNVFEFSETDFFNAYRALSDGKSESDEYYRVWDNLVSARSVPDDLPLSQAFVASQLMPRIPDGAAVHFAILNSLRNWNLFDTENFFESYSNVAAFGIDGCLSTFIGHSVVVEELTFLIIGDLSFFYDMNALGIREVKNNARVALINNSGGAEFRMYSNAASEFGEDANKHIAAAGHNSEAAGWAKSMGWEYVPIRTKNDLIQNIDVFFSSSDKPVFFEIFTTMKDDSNGVKRMIRSNVSRTLSQRLAGTLSPGNKRRIKKILGK